MAVQYNIVTKEGEAESVTAFVDGHNLVANSDHPNFSAIVGALRESTSDTSKIRGLFDITAMIGERFARLSERVSAAKGHVYFDGDPVADALAQTVAKFWTAGTDGWEPLVNFMEKIAQNPNPHSRDHLFRWLEKHDFALTADGDFIAYKGLDNDLTSVHSGRAIVNGTVHNGKIPNQPGTVIEMPRSQVTFDSRVGCSTGLHAGNWRYARSFASRIMEVKINPRDVVSVPSDSNDEKLRVCRYQVVGEVKTEDTGLIKLGYQGTARFREEKPAEATPEVTPKTPKADTKTKGKKETMERSTDKTPSAEGDELPGLYEQFSRAQFASLKRPVLRFLAKEWGVKVPKPQGTKEYAYHLDYAARGRRKSLEIPSVK